MKCSILKIKVVLLFAHVVNSNLQIKTSETSDDRMEVTFQLVHAIITEHHQLNGELSDPLRDTVNRVVTLVRVCLFRNKCKI